MIQKTLKTIDQSFVFQQPANFQPGCKYQLTFNKMILENCKKRKQNLSGAWKILRTI